MAQRDRGPWVNPDGGGEPLAASTRYGDVVNRGGTFYQSTADNNLSVPGLDTNWTPLGDPIASYLRPSSLKRETFPRAGVPLVDQANTNFTSGEMYGQAISLLAGDLVTNIVFDVGATASATVTHRWVALYDSGGNLLRQSTDDTGVMAANTLVSKALSSPYQITVSGLYYIMFMTTATTLPSLVGVTSAAGLSASFGSPPIGATDTTHVGLTTTAPNPATIAGWRFQLYGGIS